MSEQQSIYDRIMSQNVEEASSSLGDELEHNDSGQVHEQSHVKWVKRVILAIGCAIIIVVVTAWATGTWPVVLDALAQKASRKAAPQLPDSPFLTQAKGAKLSSCGVVFPVLGNQLTQGTTYKILTSFHTKKPDGHAVQSLVGMTYASAEYSGPAAGLVFASPNGKECEGALVRVVPFAKACAEVEKALPQGSKAIELLASMPVYEMAGNGGQVMLVPAQTGCVVVTVGGVSSTPNE